ncbi:T9SS type A sorting domain-containing protein [Nonlabens xiamenensis]|uniref:T9SS type A sorting domain-containing protein n=1 Tax=Nonlabens xiamenensis TaxID=2341043 RepID=UPI000F612DFC|nr:T9SS type A sorting domain-containing protein [Nonlabens xiamenensis]
MKKILFIPVILFLFQWSTAQVTNEAIPRSWGLSISKNNVPVKDLPAIDFESVKKQDAVNDKLLGVPYRFAINIPAQINLFDSGSWTVLPNGDRIWMMEVHANDATTINFIFDRYDLPEGAELYIYSKDKSDRIGPYTAKENQPDGQLGSWVIRGDHVVLEYFEPAAVKGLGRLSISEIGHGYRGLSKADEVNAKMLNNSGPCNVDVLCDPNFGSSNGQDWTPVRDDFIHAVARIIIPRNGATFTCTGTMINNTNADTVPYFYTANHCIDTADGATGAFNGSNYSFGFEWYTNTPDCATFNPTQGPANPSQVLSGAVLRANHSGSDTALLELNQTPPASWDLYYAGWDRSTNVPSSQLGVHHPAFDIMKLCRNDQPAVNQTISFGGAIVDIYTVGDWDYGVTEGGSSGSVLLSPSGHIVGELLGGGAACSGTTDNGSPDFYGRFNIAWNGGGTNSTRLRNWLDPANLGVSVFDGDYFSTLSVDGIANEQADWSIYPNPVDEILNVEVQETARYNIYDITGAVLMTGVVEQNKPQLNIAELRSGMYFFSIELSGKREVKKIIKK